MAWPKGVPRSGETKARQRATCAKRPVPLCTCCGRPRARRKDGGWTGAHGWCGGCYRRWCLDGRPASGPPAPMAAIWRNAIVNQRRVLEAAWRRGEFARLRSAGYSTAQAARVLGVTYGCGWKYERSRLAARGQEAARNEAA